jgi:hypothetical protein
VGSTVPKATLPGISCTCRSWAPGRDQSPVAYINGACPVQPPATRRLRDALPAAAPRASSATSNRYPRRESAVARRKTLKTGELSVSSCWLRRRPASPRSRAAGTAIGASLHLGSRTRAPAARRQSGMHPSGRRRRAATPCRTRRTRDQSDLLSAHAASFRRTVGKPRRSARCRARCSPTFGGRSLAP